MIKIISILRKTYWFIFRPRTKGVKALIIKDNKILLIKNTYEKLLLLPGGKVGQSESSDEALERELNEELRLVVKKSRLLGEYVNEGEYKKDIIYLYLVESFDFQKEKGKSKEIEHWDFYEIDNLPNNVSPATRRRLEENQKGLTNGGNW